MKIILEWLKSLWNGKPKPVKVEDRKFIDKDFIENKSAIMQYACPFYDRINKLQTIKRGNEKYYQNKICAYSLVDRNGVHIEFKF